MTSAIIDRLDGLSSSTGSIVGVIGATTTNVSAAGWTATTFGRIDARTAENIGAVTETAGGSVLVA